MITKKNLNELLKTLNFAQSNKLWTKTMDDKYGPLTIDFAKEKIGYPKGVKINDQTTCNFSHPENFVVFECVHRLLEKGYRPEHIELERRWPLGHEQKSGKADIIVTGEDGKTLLIIECKTAGQEYSRAYSALLNNGGQLFSYWQQEQSCKWLVLYSSKFNEDTRIVEYKALTVNCTDDANILLLAKDDKSIKLYRDARTAKERYATWKETYERKLLDDLVFSNNSSAYNIEIPPLRKKDLLEFKPSDKIVNRFEEILRHNNVSDKENAFNRLVALFICKLVDEITKRDDDEVEFQYKQGTDTYETLQDRLQRLHHDGMEKFMREEIYYIPANYPEWLFSTYTGSERKKAIEDLRKTIRSLKYYSNNDFAFKDVHNEKLFYQNGKILVEMVHLFERYRIVYPSKNQFLGDLFEQLLNKGFKQNEGQFFTPVPITRFIWDSLPVESNIKSNKVTVYPKVIDYACGAGHFLTEAVEAINYHSKNAGGGAWIKDHIYGIEKDYRLARVAKISLFMNGAGDGNIIFGDGLENMPDAGIVNGTFDILVANPPYAVKDFKQHLQLNNNTFMLLDHITQKGDEIETLFVERINQLLKPQGIAAVILPSSILDKNKKSFVGARECILQNFFIRAIVALGSCTFGATGTQTVIMFLEKFNEPPKQIDLSIDSVDSIFSGESTDDWMDEGTLESYCQKINVDKDTYKSFIDKSYTLDDLTAIEYFNMYAKAFDESREAKTLQTTNSYLNKNEDEQKSIYLKKLYDYVHSVEREKLLYFSLVYQQKTLIISSPKKIKAQKKFLGYEWSNRKGSEGIRITSPGGKLYKNGDRNEKNTLAHAIKCSFNGEDHQFTEEQLSYAVFVNTMDMLDFSKEVFSNTLSLIMKKAEIKSKYGLTRICDIVTIETGSRPQGGVSQYDEGVISIGGEHIGLDGRLKLENLKYVPRDFYNKRRNGKIKENDILICKDGAQTGKIIIVKNELSKKEAMINEHVFLLRCNNLMTQKFLFYFLFSKTGQDLLKGNITGSSQGGLNCTNLKNIKVPYLKPETEVMKNLVTKCEEIENDYENRRMNIDLYKQEIEKQFNEMSIIVP